MSGNYNNNFLKEVAANVEGGDWVKMCMQCGVCAGSCPFGDAWEHTPQKIFTMIRAGKREEVLSSNAMWMCTSCYNCIVRCPRELPITHIMHGLARYAKVLGIEDKKNPTAKFGQLFWNNLYKTGRINELKLGISLYFMNGIINGIKTSLKMKKIGFGMWKTQRLNPLELIGGHSIKDTAGLKNILAKAAQIEADKLKK